MKIAEDFWKSKTTWAGITGIIGAVAGVATGAMSLAEAIQLAMISALGMFIRDAVKS